MEFRTVGLTYPEQAKAEPKAEKPAPKKEEPKKETTKKK